jgi:hypothetical protein
MDQDLIAQAIRRGLPKPKHQKYLSFVNRYLLLRDKDAFLDPFIIEVPMDEIESIYIERDNIDKRVYEQGCSIIVGTRGSGKTILWQKQHSGPKWQQRHKALCVSLLFKDRSIATKDWGAFLVYHIFSAYRGQLLGASREIDPFLPYLLRNPQWLRAFHRLSHYCYLRQLQTADNTFEFLPLLSDTLHDQLGDNVSSAEMLQELFDLVSLSGQRCFGTQLLWPYQRIQVFIDGTEHLSDEVVIDLLNNLQKLCSNVFNFKLFISKYRQDVINKFSSSEPELIYPLPQWNAEQLRNLLIRRLITWGPQGLYGSIDDTGPTTEGIPGSILLRLRDTLSRCDEFENNEKLAAVFIDDRISNWRYSVPQPTDLQTRVDALIGYLFDVRNSKGESGLVLFLYTLRDRKVSSGELEQQLTTLIADLEPIKRQSPQPANSPLYFSDWALQIPVEHLERSAKREFIRIIVEGALRAYTHPTEFDAPIHALKLARGLIAACAGCWQEQFPPPLNAQQLQEIVNLYWEEEKYDG